MTLDELITEARTRADDLTHGVQTSGAPASDTLWTRAEWITWANEAQREACRRARLIVDSTSEVAQIQLSAGEPTAEIDPRVIFIRRAKLAGRSQPLSRVSAMDLDCHVPDWETQTGEPRMFVPDMDSLMFRAFPTPTVDADVALTVVRLPLSDMKIGTNKPEIRPHLHMSLVTWMLYRAFSKPDEDTKDSTKAAFNLAEFESEFGMKSTAIDEAWIEREYGYLPNEGLF